MRITEDRISHLAHKIIEKLWRDDLADFAEEPRALEKTKQSIAEYFAVAEEVDDLVRRKLDTYAQKKVPGSREWEILYQKFYQEEMGKRKW